jgi:aryl-alcohol dehydrogenase-like predicted oxidoreductase
VIGKLGDIEGVWIEPVTAQVTMTLLTRAGFFAEVGPARRRKSVRMKTVALGKQGLKVSAMGLGCMMIAGHYGPSDADESQRVIDAALDGGITLFDTADVYGGAQNEVFVGKALAKVRDRVQIATKFGFTRPGGGGKGPGGGASGAMGVDGSPTHVHEACDASLGRLGIETIDLYYLHRVDPKVPIEETVGAMAELVKSGKVRYLGLSEVAEATLRRAHKIHPISAVQNEYSPWSREPEKLFGALDELGVGLVAYSPLGRGFFTGTINSYAEIADNDNRKGYPRYKAFEENRPIIDRFKALAERHGCSPAQLALAFVMTKRPGTVPIPGTKHVKHMLDNLAAVDVVLSPAEVAEIDDIVASVPVVGDRYADTSLLQA